MCQISRRDALLTGLAVVTGASAAENEKTSGSRPFSFKADSIGGVVELHPWSFAFSKKIERVFVPDGSPPVPAPKPPEQRLVVKFENEMLLQTRHRDVQKTRVVERGIFALSVVDGLHFMQLDTVIDDESCAYWIEKFATHVLLLVYDVQVRNERLLTRIHERYANVAFPNDSAVAVFGRQLHLGLTPVHRAF